MVPKRPLSRGETTIYRQERKYKKVNKYNHHVQKHSQRRKDGFIKAARIANESEWGYGNMMAHIRSIMREE